MTLTEYPDVEQRSDEWHALRCGMVTASAVGTLITVGPPDPRTVACPTCNAAPNQPCVSAARKEPTAIKSLHDARTTAAATRPPVYTVADNEGSRALTALIVAERINGWTEETPMSSDMWRGVDHEPFARDAYSEHFAPVVEMGFMIRREKGWALGFSPDGVVGDDGLIEIKVPRAKHHLRTILEDKVPPQYVAQLQAGLLVSGRPWIDYVSFCAGMPLYRKRVTPDPDWFAAIEAACRAFEEAAERMVDDYLVVTTGLPDTERLDNTLGLVF